MCFLYLNLRQVIFLGLIFCNSDTSSKIILPLGEDGKLVGDVDFNDLLGVPEQYKSLLISSKRGRLARKSGLSLDLPFNGDLYKAADQIDNVLLYAFKNNIPVIKKSSPFFSNLFNYVKRLKSQISAMGAGSCALILLESALLDDYNAFTAHNIAKMRSGDPIPLYAQASAVGMMPLYCYVVYYLFFIPFTDILKVISDPHAQDIKLIKCTKPFSLEQIGGCLEAKRIFRDITMHINNPDLVKLHGLSLPKGVLLYGPPGTGKTLLAKALAYEADCAFLALTSSDFKGAYGPNVITNIFKIARSAKRVVLFIDEIENIVLSRDNPKNTKADVETLSTFLAELDGFNTSESEIIIIGATNYLQAIDPAILRPGRFDYVVKVDLPDENGRLEILNIHTRKVNLGKNVNLSLLATITEGFSGAELKKIIDVAKRFALRDKTIVLAQKHLLNARNYLVYGEEKCSSFNAKDLERKARHEAAHALLAKDCCTFLRHFQVSLVERAKMGMIETSDSEHWKYLSHQEYKEMIKCCLASVVLSEISGEKDLTSDLAFDKAKASELAEDMIRKYGVAGKKSLRFTEEEITKYVDAELDTLYAEVKSYLLLNKVRLDKLTIALMQARVLTNDDMREMG